MSRPLIWRACGLTVILALCTPGGHGLHTGARGLPGPARSYVALFDARTGRVRATPSAFGSGGSVGNIAVDPRTSRAFVVTTATNREADSGPPDAVMSVLDTRSGRVVANVTVADVQVGTVYPAGIAVDTRRGRVYVVTTPLVSNSPQPVHSTP